MSNEYSKTASMRLAAARTARETAANDVDAACGSSREFHAAVQLRAAADQVEAREAWLAWSDGAHESG